MENSQSNSSSKTRRLHSGEPDTLKSVSPVRGGVVRKVLIISNSLASYPTRYALNCCHQVGEHEIKTKAVPICESIEERKYAKAEEVSVASVIRYSL